MENTNTLKSTYADAFGFAGALAASVNERSGRAPLQRSDAAAAFRARFGHASGQSRFVRAFLGRAAHIAECRYSVRVDHHGNEDGFTYWIYDLDQPRSSGLCGLNVRGEVRTWLHVDGTPMDVVRARDQSAMLHAILLHHLSDGDAWLYVGLGAATRQCTPVHPAESEFLCLLGAAL